MDETLERRAGDRRQTKRRSGAETAYTGPERRIADRRSGTDRRKSARIVTTLPEALD